MTELHDHMLLYKIIIIVVITLVIITIIIIIIIIIRYTETHIAVKNSIPVGVIKPKHNCHIDNSVTFTLRLKKTS